MADDFAWDVFIAYSRADGAVVRTLAKELEAAGLRVWPASRRARARQRIEIETESALERSRVLVLCMSSAALGPDWARLEAQTLRFRDPLNIHRGFVPLRLDDSKIPHSLAQFAVLDWRPASSRDDRGWRDLLSLFPAPELLTHPADDAPGQVDPPYAVKLHHGATFVQAYGVRQDGRQALSVSEDGRVRLWDLEDGRCLRVLEGHTGRVWTVALDPDGRHALSGSLDTTVRLWDLEDGRCLRVLEGHTGAVYGVAWGPDGRRVYSGDQNGVVQIWDLTEVIAEAQSHLDAGPAVSSTPVQVQYTNAKVLLVGDSGAGKTGLSRVLAGQPWAPSDSTVGAWATQWKLPVEEDKGGSDGVEREVWLWDFGGQADQRLIHQLYMDETALAVLVFDGQKEDVFETLGQWDRDLTPGSKRLPGSGSSRIACSRPARRSAPTARS
jgi:hypothetical protein